MDGVILAIVLAMVFLVPLVALTIAAWRHGGEQCPEREPDLSDEERAYLQDWAKSNRWEM